MAFRIDMGRLSPPRRMADGRLRVDGYLTRSGVFTYQNPDGTKRLEYRPPSEVFKADSLDTFALVPVTDDHPEEPVNSENATRYARGAVGETIRKDGDHVAASLVVFDAGLIAKMEAGKVALSCGYEADIEESPGVTPDGIRYDSVQHNIRGNHVAIVDIARAGAAARVRMDAAYQSDESRKEHAPMSVENKEAAYEKALERAFAEKTRADAAEVALTASRSETATEKARADAAEKALALAEKARKDSDDSISERVAARVELASQVAKVLAGVDISKMSDREVRAAYVKRVDGDEIPATELDAYVVGRFKGALKRDTACDDALAGSRRAVADSVASEPEFDDEETARKKAEARTAAKFANGGK